MEYLFTVPALLSVALFLDGAIRLLAAIAGQALGTTPLYLVAWVHGHLERRAARKRLAPLVRDIVDRPAASDELRIASCRPRRNWDQWMTVMYEEKLYEIAGEEIGTPARPFVYILRPKPESKVIRGFDRYDPDEVFTLGD